MNSELFTPAFCYGAAIAAAFVTALSQIILKKQANITEAKKSGFFSKFLNPRVIISYGLLFSTLVINQVALIHVPVSVMPCITATSFVWVFIMGVLILKERSLPAERWASPSSFWVYQHFYILKLKSQGYP